ncbi:MAG: hypothetical protein IT445_15585 [Phycisphaeraceae bacterium]|nr:hypothetical protein [Phycisphaeraceae bacterium]
MNSKPTLLQSTAFRAAAHWRGWLLVVLLVVFVAVVYYPEVAYWVERTQQGSPYGLAQRWPFGQQVHWRTAAITRVVTLRDWSAKYHLWLSPLTRDGIVFSVLLFYLLVRQRRPPVTQRHVFCVGVICYLLGCVASVWLFYLRFGYFRFLEPYNHYGFWEELARPVTQLVSMWQGQAVPMNSVGFEHMMNTVWPYYVRAPLIILAVFCVSAWLMLRGKRTGASGYYYKCGYDLRGSAESAQCPECGANIARPKPDLSR